MYGHALCFHVHYVYFLFFSSFFFAYVGAFNPNSEDPLPGQMKKQLVLKIISGQQLPKPKDSMMGDRGEVEHTQTYFPRSINILMVNESVAW